MPPPCKAAHKGRGVSGTSPGPLPADLPRSPGNANSPFLRNRHPMLRSRSAQQVSLTLSAQQPTHRTAPQLLPYVVERSGCPDATRPLTAATRGSCRPVNLPARPDLHPPHSTSQQSHSPAPQRQLALCVNQLASPGLRTPHRRAARHRHLPATRFAADDTVLDRGG